MKKKILFLMSDTGGGHRASAEAISEAIHHLYPDQYETIVEDVWKNYTPYPFSKLPDSYSWLTGDGLWLWKLMWKGSVHGVGTEQFFNLMAPIVRKRLVQFVQEVDPDLIISVHPLMNHLGVDWLKHAGLDIPFVTVVTDMVSLHPTWICPEVTRCIVPTDSAFERALNYGMPKEKLMLYGQPVSMRFATQTGDKIELREQLGLDIEAHTILLAGGGEGYGPLYEIAHELDRSVSNAQLLIVAGRNKKLQQQLENAAWRNEVHVFGFVNNMPELMSAADLLITKAGPGTISEAFIAGIPTLISGYIPGQEAGNVDYVREHNAGAYAEAPREIADIVSGWLTSANAALQQMSRNARELARPEASLHIAADVCQLLKQPERTLDGRLQPYDYADEPILATGLASR